jgi:Holliday junction resolvase RusA-like endonuclease
VAASRPRVSKWGAYYKGPYKTFRQQAIDVVLEVIGDHEPYDEPLSVSIEIVVTRPKTTTLDHPKPDIDNYVKGVLDALNGLLWIDDHQIVTIVATKQWAPVGEDGYFEVHVSPV